MKTKLALTFLFLVTACVTAAEPELKGAPSELTAYLAGVPKIVSVTGDGEATAQADRATIMLRVATEHKSLQEAFRANQELRGKVADLLKDRGLAADQIKAARFSSTPKYGVFSDKAKSYRVANQVTITVRNENEFQAVAAAVDKWPDGKVAFP
jgi:hypothetical protein